MFVFTLPNETLIPPPKLTTPCVAYAVAEQPVIVLRCDENKEPSITTFPVFPPTLPMKIDRQPPCAPAIWTEALPADGTETRHDEQ